MMMIVVVVVVDAAGDMMNDNYDYDNSYDVHYYWPFYYYCVHRFFLPNHVNLSNIRMKIQELDGFKI